MAQILDLGKLRFNWRGAYSGSTEYTYNDVVKYGPNLYAYKATSAGTGIVPTTTANWALVTEGFTWRGTYTASTFYYKNDIITDGTSAWVVTTEHTSNDPAQTGSNGNIALFALGQEGLPNQSGNANKVLTSNGSTASWSDEAHLSVVYAGTTQGTAADNFETTAGLTDVSSVFAKSSSNFSQLVMVNPSNGVNASSDFISYTADGDNDSGWIDMGITSNNFSTANYGITGPHDGYIFMSAPRGVQRDVSAARVIGTTATLTTTVAHGYQVGNIVKIEGVAAGGGTGLVDQLVTVTAISSTTFSFVTNVTPFSDTNLAPFGTVYKPKGDGNLVFATDKTGLSNSIVFAAGGYESGTAQMTISPNEVVHISIATESTEYNTGALVVTGGLGVGGKAHVQGDLQTYGEIFVGAEADEFQDTAALTDPIAVFAYDGNPASFAQVAIHNSEPSSSSDILLYSDNGNDEFGWIDFGITGSTFQQELYGITGQNEGYIFFQTAEPVVKNISNKALTSNVATITTTTAHGFLAGQRVVIANVGAPFNGTYTIASVPTTTTFTYAKTATNVTSAAASGTATNKSRGNLVIATGGQGTENAILFGAGGYDSGNTQMAIYPDQKVVINIATASTSPTTGALVVNGGVGITGDVNVAGNITFGGTGTQVSTANLAVSAPLIFTGSGSTVNNYDLGLVTEGKYSITNIPVGKVVNKELTSNVATLTTFANHNLIVGDSVVIANVDATFNGTYSITAVPSATTFSYAKTASQVTSARIGDVSYSINNKLLQSNVATLTTTATHDYLVGEIVAVTGVDATFNGSYTITAVTGTTFSYAKTASNVSSTAVSPVGTATVNRSLATATVSSASRTRWAAWFKNDSDGVWNLVSNISTLPVTNIDLAQDTYGNGADIAWDSIKVKDVTALGNVSITGTTNSAGNFSVATNKFTVAATTGNTAVAGTLAVTGAVTLTDDIAVNGGDLTTTAATFNLVDTTATTVNVARAGTAITVGASNSGTLTLRNATTAISNAATVGGTLGVTGNTTLSGTLGVTGTSTFTGNATFNGTATFNSSVTVSGTERFTGRFDVQEIREDVVDVSLASNVATCDYTAGNVYYCTTNPSANWTMNLTNVPTDNGKMLSVSILMTMGGTGYYPATFQIDGSSQTVKWIGGTNPSPTSGSGKIDVYNFNLLRTSAGAWIVFGSANLNY